MIPDLDNPVVPDHEVLSIMAEESEGYFSGTQDLPAAVKAIISKGDALSGGDRIKIWFDLCRSELRERNKKEDEKQSLDSESRGSGSGRGHGSHDRRILRHKGTEGWRHRGGKGQYKTNRNADPGTADVAKGRYVEQAVAYPFEAGRERVVDIIQDQNGGW